MYADQTNRDDKLLPSAALIGDPRRHRQTALARRRRLLRAMRDFATEHGIDKPSPADRAALEQAAVLSLQLADLQEAKVRGEHVAADALIRTSGELRRVLVGLRRRQPARKALTLRERIAAGVWMPRALKTHQRSNAGDCEGIVSSLDFFGRLKWLDGRPLLDTIEPYRRNLFAQALDTNRPDGTPVFNFVLSGRGKKNWKTADLVLAALYCLLIRVSPTGNECYILANDEDQAGDDLDLAKKLVAANPDELGTDVEVLAKEIRRQDGAGLLRILPARDAIGQHGKTALFVGFDEIHGYRTYDLFEALAPDPTRTDALTWVTSYDTIYNTPGVPLVDFKAMGKAGSDPRMVFAWYSGDYCSDPDFAEFEPELRANPSIGSWPEGRGYLDQQRRRLPTHKFRRLHLNLPGAPNGAFLDQGSVLAAIVVGRGTLPPQPDVVYSAFVDMSGGSSDDATLSIAHKDPSGRAVVDLVESQAGEPPFNPRNAVRKFAVIIKAYRLSNVTGDNYAGQTFKSDFEAEGIAYTSSPVSKSALYEALEPVLNAGSAELPDIQKLQEQLLTLVIKGARIDHQPGDHDDWANAAAGAVWCVLEGAYANSTGLLEYYRRAAAGELVNKPAATIMLRGPADTALPTHVIGIDGFSRPVRNGTVAVPADDVPPLTRQGWQIEGAVT